MSSVTGTAARQLLKNCRGKSNGLFTCGRRGISDSPKYACIRRLWILLFLWKAKRLEFRLLVIPVSPDKYAEQ